MLKKHDIIHCYQASNNRKNCPRYKIIRYQWVIKVIQLKVTKQNDVVKHNISIKIRISRNLKNIIVPIIDSKYSENLFKGYIL